MESFIYLIYTHEDYTDILDIHLKRLKKYCDYLPLSICTNNKKYILENYSNVYFKNIIEYDDKKPYGERLRQVLSNISEKYVLFNHEHNILVGNVEKIFIMSLLQKMEQENIDQVRMFISGIGNPQFPPEVSIIKNDGPYYMSCATTLWKKDSLLDIVQQFSEHTFRCFECEPIQAYVSRLKNFYLTSSKDTPFLEEGHYLSYAFPVAHLTGTGKWRTNTPTNRMFIEEIEKEYDIDLNKRGRL